MRLNKLVCFFICACFFIFSCSLNYGDKKKGFDKKPNFVFINSNLDKYEKNSISLKIIFDKLEIYDEDKVWAGENVEFIRIEKDKYDNPKFDGKEIVPASKGYAGIIKIDESKNKYYLGKNVFFQDMQEGVEISGQAFFWDKTENILYAPDGEKVSVKRKSELDIQGAGFSANTLSREFEFNNTVTGVMSNDFDKETAEQQSNGGVLPDKIKN